MVQSQAVDTQAPDKPTNLKPVIAVIPPECYENPTWRGVLWGVRDLAIYAALVAALVMVDSAWLLLLWPLAGLSIAGLFILGHDAAHGALFKSKRMNLIWGQLMFLPSLHMYEGWVFGHNRLHHGHTTREQMDFVWHPATPEQHRSMSLGARLYHRICWSAIGPGVYYLVEIWWRKMVIFKLKGPRAKPLRIQKVLVFLYTAIFTAALLAGGYAKTGTGLGAVWMWVKVFLIPFLIWNHTIGFTTYLHHIGMDITWRKRKEWNPYLGQVEGTVVLHIPWVFNQFFHNIFLHVAHHVDMRIPFYNLDRATDAIRGAYGDVLIERKFSLLDYLRTTRRCKLFDFQTGRWLPYGTPIDSPADVEPLGPVAVPAASV